MLKDFVKRVLRSLAKNRGYLISKYPTVKFNPIPVFELAARLRAAQGVPLQFVQVGANDGVIGDSVSKLAIELNWRGILIEPQPDVFERLKQTYAAYADRMVFENVAISKNAGELTMYRAPQANQFASTVASSNPEVTSKQLNIPIEQLEKIKVPCLPLDDLFEKHGFSQPDILVIDTEGYDLVVLESLDLKKYQPLIIQFESGHLSPSEIDKAVNYLSVNGYQVLYGGYQIDTICLHQRYWDAVKKVA